MTSAASSASSSTNSERDERVFIAAFGLMDSPQDGEAVAAFMRVRAILRRHGGGFRHMLERSHEAERLNEELGQQNAQLLRENNTLRARDSRAAPSSPIGAERPFVIPALPELRHWDIGLIGLVGISANYGLLNLTASCVLAAAILITAAFANRFSPIRLLAGIVLGLTALGIVVLSRSASADVTIPAAVDAPAAFAPATTGNVSADAAPPSQISSDSSPPRRTAGSHARHRWSAGIRCGPHRLEPGFTCPRSTSWRRNFFRDLGRLSNARYG